MADDLTPGEVLEAPRALSEVVQTSNGPVRGHGGWLGRRERSGDWMVEQAVHVWDVLHWIAGSVPRRSAKRRARRQQRSTRSATPLRPSERNAA